MPPVSSFLVLVVVMASLVASQRQARPGVSQTSYSGEKEGAVRGRVSLLRAARAYRRFGESNRLQMPARQPVKKAPKRSNSLSPKTVNSSVGKDVGKVNTASRQPQATGTRARPKGSVGNTRKKYAGVKFPKLDLFPQMRKASLSGTRVLKGNTTVRGASLPSQYRAGQGQKSGQSVNSKALEIEYRSKGKHRTNLTKQNQRSKPKSGSIKKKYPNSRPDIRPTPSLSRDIPDKPTPLAPSNEDSIPAPVVMPSISADAAGFLTVTHTVFTRTKDLYEETLTSLSEVVAMTKVRSTIINNSEIMFAHSEYHHPSRGVTELIFEEICPTQTLLSQARTLVPAYNVLTHTTRITNTAQATLPDMQGEGEVGVRIQDIMSHLLPTTRLPPSTSYTTITLTKISTITSDVTSDITITLGGRPVKTEYVTPTTMVFTDLHISRSAIVV